MVTTRGQTGVAKPKKALNNAISPKRLVQFPNLKLTVREPNSPLVKRRQSLSVAPKLGTHVLFLFIGASRELVTIHSDLLPDSTKAYIAERNVGEQVYQLPDEDIAVFQIYRLFLYTGTVYSFTDNDQDLPDNGRRTAHADAEWTRLAHCYLLGVTMKDERFANAAIDAIIEKMTLSDRYPTGLSADVYSFTTAGDKLRTLLVDVHVWNGRGTYIKPPHDDATGPVEFLQDVIQGLAMYGARIHQDEVVMPWQERPCAYYHVHEVTGKCRR